MYCNKPSNIKQQHTRVILMFQYAEVKMSALIEICIQSVVRSLKRFYSLKRKALLKFIAHIHLKKKT